MRPLITVIVPVYNVFNYLEKCLDSIINQSYENLDILIIDDGSNDGSEKISDKYKKKDKRIRVIHKENEGIAKTRNLGIKEARGKYIGWVDSDDYIDKNMYEILYNTLVEHDASIAICNYTNFDKEEPKLGLGSGKIYTFDKMDALKELLKDNIITNHSVNKLFKREVFKGVRCPVNRKYEDISYIYKTIINSDKIVYIDRVLYAYYQRSGSTVHTIDKKTVIDFYKAYDERNKYLFKNIDLMDEWLVSDRIFSILLLYLLIAKFGNKELYNLDIVLKVYSEYKEIWNIKKLISIKNSKKILALLLYINRDLFYVVVSSLCRIRDVLRG